MKTRLALFDLDGTLYDTRRVNFLSYQKALEQFGYTMDYEYFANQCNGRHYKTFLPEIMQSETHMEEVHELKKKYYGDFLSETVVRYAYELVQEIPDVRIYGDFSAPERAAIVSLNLGGEDSARVSDWLAWEHGIFTRAGGHCAPLMHGALGTREQGAVRFSFSHFNTDEEVETAAAALRSYIE